MSYGSDRRTSSLSLTIPPTLLARADEVIGNSAFQMDVLLHMLTAANGTCDTPFAAAAISSGT
jgi:hypothetical protein